MNGLISIDFGDTEAEKTVSLELQRGIEFNLIVAVDNDIEPDIRE